MLRRKPTALTISPEDLVAFEEAHARKLALARYRSTGEDPNGWFTHGDGDGGSDDGENTQQQQHYQARSHAAAAAAGGGGGVQRDVDPNDELKPLPGDKARIVRSREERIMGTTAAAAAGSGSGSGTGR